MIEGYNYYCVPVNKNRSLKNNSRTCCCARDCHLYDPLIANGRCYSHVVWQRGCPFRGNTTI